MSKNVGTIYYEIDAQTGKLIEARNQSVKSLDDIERSAGKTDKAVSRLNTKVKTLAKGIHTAIAAMAIGTVWQINKAFVDMAENIKNLQARIALLSPDVRTAQQTFRDLKRISNDTGSAIEDVQSLWEGLTRSLKSKGASNDQILNITATIQKMGRIGGASAEQMKTGMTQFRQAIDGGIVKAEEFNSMIESTPYVIDQVAKQMGMTKGELRQHMLDGKLYAVDMVNAIQKATDEVNTEFSKLPKTSGQAVNELRNEFIALIGKVDSAFGISDNFVKLLEAGAPILRKFGEDMDTLAGYTDTFKGYIGEAKEGLQALVNMKDSILGFFGDFGDKIEDAAVKAFQLVPGIKAIVDGYKALQDLIDGRKPTINQMFDDPINEITAHQAVAEDLLDQIKKEYAANQQKQKDERPLDKTELPPDTTTPGKPSKPKKTTKSRNTGKSPEQTERERLVQSGVALADSLNREIGLQKKAKEQAEALKAAMDDGKITNQEYAGALDELNRIYLDSMQQERIKKAVTPEQEKMGQVDPIQQIQNEWAMRKAMLTELGATEATIKQQQLAYEQQLLDLKWQQWQAQGDTNALVGAMVNDLGEGATNAITGLLNGTQSLKESFANIGSTILNTVVGAIVEMGTEYVKQQILAAATSKATQAATTAGTVASMGAIGAAAAPAAAAVSTATMGGAVGMAMSALSGLMSFASSLFAGKRYNGGSVLGGNLYRVGEGGKPELFQSGSHQYMIPGDNGRITSNKNAFGDGSANNFNFNIEVNTTNGWSDEDSRRLEETVKRISMAQIREQATRPGGILQPRR